MRIINLFFCLTILFFSCSEKEGNTLSFSDPKFLELDFSENLKIKNTVYFNFPDSLLIGIVEGVEFEKDKIIIHQEGVNSSLLFFDQNGNFDKVLLKMGSGPGEYNKIDFFFISNSTIYIYDRSKMSFILYDLDTLNFIKEYPLEFYLVSGFSLNSQGDLILVSDSFFSEGKQNGLILANFDKQEFKINPQFAAIIEAFNLSNFSTIGDELFISLPFLEKVIKLDDKEFLDFMQIDFVAKALPKQVFKIEDAYDFYDLLESGSYFFAIHNFNKSEYTLSFNFYDESIDNIQIGLINLESNENYILRTKNDFEANFIKAVNVRNGKINSFLMPGEYSAEDLSNLNLEYDSLDTDSIIMIQYNYELSK